MKLILIATLLLSSLSSFAARDTLSGVSAKSLFYSLQAQKASGSTIEVHEGSVKNGYQTSLSTKDGAILCTRSEMKKATSFSCEVTE